MTLSIDDYRRAGAAYAQATGGDPLNPTYDDVTAATTIIATVQRQIHEAGFHAGVDAAAEKIAQRIEAINPNRAEYPDYDGGYQSGVEDAARIARGENFE